MAALTHPSPTSVLPVSTTTSADAALSPFVLDPSAVVLRQKRTRHSFDGTFLRTPVSVRVAKSRSSALRTARYMNELRHPNLEQFLGVVADPSAPQSLVVTERAPGRSVAEIAGDMRTRKMDFTQAALIIAVQTAQALVYLHAVSGRAHPALCPHALVYESHRAKTVVLLTHRCERCPKDRERPSRASDVAKLAAIIIDLTTIRNSLNSSLTHSVGNALAATLAQCSAPDPGKRPKMKDLCAELLRHVKTQF